MKKCRNLFLLALLILALIPIKTEAYTFEGQNGIKYLLEKENLKCDLININDRNASNYHGRDKEFNFIYSDFNNDYYKVNINGCSKMEVEDVLDFYSETSLWYDLEGTNINKITHENFDISHIEVTDGLVDSNKNYCQFEKSLNNYVCGLDKNSINTSIPFFEVVYVKHLKNLEVDYNKEYYIISKNEKSLNTLIEVSPSDVENSILENKSNALKYYEIIENYEKSDFFKAIENQIILNFLKDENYIYESVAYDEKNDLFYFTFFDTIKEKIVVYDSEGNRINTTYQIISIFSNSLMLAYDYSSDKSVILDNSGTILYESNIRWHLEEASYDNYVLDLYDVDNVSLYRIYEYKLLYENNKVIKVDKYFEIKFSGLLDKVKSNSITINGKVLDKSYYTLASGSTIVTLKNDYLSTLEEGKYTILIKYEGDIELQAQFEINKSVDAYKVIFDSNGGIFSDNKTLITIANWKIGDEETIEKPSRKGYEFIGFFTKKEGGTSFEKYLAEAGIDNDLTFYAQWKKEEENPKTFDKIESSIFIGIVSLIGVVGTIIYLKRRSTSN